MFSSTSFAEWTQLGVSKSGDTYYLDFESIRKVDGFIYFWSLTDFLKPDEWGDLSYKTYLQGDCKLFRIKYLSFSYHKQPMGGGTGVVKKTVKIHQGWKYPPANSANEFDPPPLNWSTVYFSKRRIEDGNQTTQTGRNCLEAASS